jgi:hypothetical protein
MAVRVEVGIDEAQDDHDKPSQALPPGRAQQPLHDPLHQRSHLALLAHKNQHVPF